MQQAGVVDDHERGELAPVLSCRFMDTDRACQSLGEPDQAMPAAHGLGRVSHEDADVGIAVCPREIEQAALEIGIVEYASRSRRNRRMLKRAWPARVITASRFSPAVSSNWSSQSSIKTGTVYSFTFQRTAAVQSSQTQERLQPRRECRNSHVAAIAGYSPNSRRYSAAPVYSLFAAEAAPTIAPVCFCPYRCNDNRIVRCSMPASMKILPSAAKPWCS